MKLNGKNFLVAAALSAFTAIAMAAMQPTAEPISDQTQIGDLYNKTVDATVNNDADKLKEALSEGIDPNTISRGTSGDPLLTLALRYKSDKAVDVLLADPRLNVNQPNLLHETPLMLAIYWQMNPVAHKLLKLGAKANNPRHWSPLHYAAAVGNLEMIDELLKRGADVNARTLRGVTPLYMAARESDARAVRALLNAGARKDFCTNDMLAPYDIAKRQGNTQEVQQLLVYDHCR